MDHRFSPRIPEKPLAYSRPSRDATTMSDLLSSLNIDEDVSADRHSVRPHDMRRSQQTLPMAQYEHGQQSTLNRYNSNEHSRSQQLLTDPTSIPANADSQMYPKYMDTTGSSGNGYEVSTPSSLQSAEKPPSTKRPTRKPVTQEAPKRTYFSPDDLDDLLVKPLPSRIVAPMTAETRQSIPSLRTSLSMPNQLLDSVHEDYRSSRESHDSFARQYSHPYSPNHESETGFAFPSRVSDLYRPVHDESNVSPSLAVMSQRQTPQFRDQETMPYPPNQQMSSNVISYDPFPQIRIPSPPSRRDSFPLSPSQPCDRPMSGFQQIPEYALPPNRVHASSQPDLRTFSPPLRQNSVPLRSMSSLSSSSSRSPDRQHRHPISELESQYYGRIPSPDRTSQFPDPVPYAATVRDGATSVPPPTQLRRGRQKGEIIMESDLPAMPPLFAHQDISGVNARPPSILASSIQAKSNGRSSPTRPTTAIPQLLSKRTKPLTKEPDRLQSIKVLPIRPMRCPPLCLEERYHPFPFVKTSKFKVKVRVDQAIFVAGGEVFGHIDIISDEGFRAQFGSTQVLVGEIGIEFIGFEEIQNSDSGHQPRSLTFLYGRKVYQTLAKTHPTRADDDYILTSAVTNDPPPDQDGYRAATRGTNSFPFAFPLPVDAPSSADMHIAKIKYLVTGYATVKLQGSQEVIATSHAIRVVEAWDVDNPVYTEPIEATQGRDIANYQEIAAIAKIPKSLYIEGQTISGSIRVNNHSSKKIKDVKFLLVNKITFFGDRRDPTKDLNPIEDTSVEQTVTGFTEPHQISKGEEESWIFNVQIPVDRCISIRNSALFEVTPLILVKISTGPLQKSTRLYISQISIANPQSMVDGNERMAPASNLLKWSNLPTLYRYQLVRRTQAQQVEKGVLELTELMTYVNAHERVMILSDRQ